MRGKRTTTRREITPDYKYNSVVVAQFINKVMLDGQKLTAREIVYNALDSAESALEKPALEIFETALKNVSPLVEVRSKRVGGATYQVPMEVRPTRKLALAMRWIIDAARKGKGKPMQDKLASEIQLAFENQGSAIAQRDAMHRMAEANKAFAHYARL